MIACAWLAETSPTNVCVVAQVEIPGLVQVVVRSAGDVDKVIAQAHRNRAVGTTQMNAHSSRSHMVMRITCSASNQVSNAVSTAIMHLVDLAGSERLARSQVSGAALKETQHINKSLSALGDVVHALQAKAKHVPYRNSKLTYLLQDALGGNAKTLMLCQVGSSRCRSECCALALSPHLFHRPLTCSTVFSHVPPSSRMFHRPFTTTPGVAKPVERT